jgi:hypothetical protein
VTADDRPPLRELDHEHPHAAGAVSGMFRRGPTAAGATGAALADVDHVAPDDLHLDPNGAFARGRGDAAAGDSDGEPTPGVDR